MALRSGIIAEKIGMSAVFSDAGVRVPVTLLKVSGCGVIAHKNYGNGVFAMQVGQGAIKQKNVTKPMLGHFAKQGVEPTRKVSEFRVSEECLVPVGAEFLASHFAVGSFVDVAGTTVGKGFAGAMKRHNFSGLRATHGVSVSHRSHGSTGNRKSPAKVFKNKKMAGHMGCMRATVQNLKVVLVDDENGILFVKGCVPGCNGAFLFVRDAVKIPPVEIGSGYRVADSRKSIEASEVNVEVSSSPTEQQENGGEE